MRSEIERIRNANFEELDRRMNQNKHMLEVMRNCLSQKKISTPIAILSPLNDNKLLRVRTMVKGLMQEMTQFRQKVRNEVDSLAQTNRQLLTEIVGRFVDELRARDGTIRQLQERIDRQEASLSFRSETQQVLQSTQSQEQLVQKADESSRTKEMQFNAKPSLSARILCADKEDLLEGLTAERRRKLQVTNMHSHRMYAHSKQQFCISDIADFPMATHKRHLTSLNSSIGGDDLTANLHVKKATELGIRSGSGINSTGDCLNSTASFAKCSVVIPEGFHMHSVHSVEQGRHTSRMGDRVGNKENGPVLPKPLRRNSVESVRAVSKDQPHPQLPVLSLPVPGKNATENGFGVWSVNGHEVYRGLWKAGIFDGRGKLKGNGWLYEGEFRNGEIDGNGILAFGQGYKWVGRFHRNRPDGDGCLTFSGRSITGTWKKGVLQKKSSDSIAQ